MTKTQQRTKHSFLNQILKFILTVKHGCTETDRIQTDVGEEKVVNELNNWPPRQGNVQHEAEAASTEPAVLPVEAGRNKEATAAVIEDEIISNSIRNDFSKNQFEVWK